MPKLIKIAYNPVVAKLYDADEDARVVVSTLLSFFVEGHEHMEKFKTTGWSGKSTLFDWLKGTFPRGFVDEVEAALQARGYTVQRICRSLPGALGPANPKVDSFGDDPRYDYQMKTVRELEKRGVMIARVATGGGKSRIAKLATARLSRPTLFVTTRTVLMHQMKAAYDEAGFTCGVMGDGDWEPDPELNVAMIQTLMTRLVEPEEDDNSSAAMRQRRIRDKTIKYLESVEFIIGEEAHEASGNSYYQVLRYCKRAEYRLALTATPFMKTNEEANMRLKAAFGPIGIEVSEQLLITRGILARPVFKIIDCQAPRKLRASTGYQRAVELGIMENEFRNTEIIRESVRACRYGLTGMILVQRKDHGRTLAEMLRAAGLRVEYIFGEIKQERRQRELKKLQTGELDVLIGSTILDVGVDVPAVGFIILAGGGKAEVQHRQRIGRGLRAKKNGPNVALIIDFHDKANKHLRTHALSRQGIVTQTPGFAENVLIGNNDFDFEKLGFRQNGRALAA